MIFIGIGGNLPSREFGKPLDTLKAVIVELGRSGGEILAQSRWYRSHPVPPSAQPEFVNAVISINSRLLPRDLLSWLHDHEARFGRVRGERWASRTVDLDLLAYHDLVQAGGDGEPALPHPRLADRAFVLRPLAEVAPEWRHPATGRMVADLLAALPPGQVAEPLDG